MEDEGNKDNASHIVIYTGVLYALLCIMYIRTFCI